MTLPHCSRGATCFVSGTGFSLSQKGRLLQVSRRSPRFSSFGRRGARLARNASPVTCVAAGGPSRLNGTGPLYGLLAGAQMIPFLFPHSGIAGDVGYFMITAVSALVIGCVRAQNEDELATPFTKQAALAAPFMASTVLVGAYCLLKYTSVDVALVFNALTTFAGTVCLKEALDPLSATLLEKLGVQSSEIDEPWKQPSAWLATAAAAAVSAAYLTHAPPNFVFSNVLAIGIAARALSLVRAESFFTAAFLLVALAGYDYIMVNRSDIMLTVALNIESPGKLLFPREIPDGATIRYPFAVLGLGDVCIPGIFVTVAAAIGEVTGGPYFKTAVAAYTAGLLACFGVNFVTSAPQPALIYLVPALLGGTLATAAARGELEQVLNFKSPKSETGSEKESLDENKK